MKPRRPRISRVFLFALVLFPPRVAGQIVLPADSTNVRPLGLSISGGISLGAYQAGVNWGVLEAYRRAGHDARFAELYGVPKYRLSSIAGASAGNINTLLWGIEACTSRSVSLPPQRSLLWDVWTSIGLPELLPRQEGGDTALFNRDFIDDTVVPAVVERLSDPALQAGCVVPAAITLTRIKPGLLWLSSPASTDSLPVMTQRYATAFLMKVVDDTLRFQPPPWASLVNLQRFGKLIVLPSDTASSPVTWTTMPYSRRSRRPPHFRLPSSQ